MKVWKTKSGYTITRVLFGRSNVFLLSDGEKNILVDTCSDKYWKALDQRLTQLNVFRIDFLILTHSHFDHAGNAQKIREKYHAKVIIHRNEGPYLICGAIIVPNGTIIITKAIVRAFGKRAAKLFTCEPCTADILTDGNFDLRQFGIHASILYTPGHSSGSISVIVDDELALVGDAMFGIFPGSIFPPFGDNIEEMVASWGKLLETNCFVFLPAHGTGNSRHLVQREYRKRSLPASINAQTD